jgi:hypothetical protein
VWAFPFAGKSGHPALHIQEERLAQLFAVARDVDARFALALHYPTGRGFAFVDE